MILLILQLLRSGRWGVAGGGTCRLVTYRWNMRSCYMFSEVAARKALWSSLDGNAILRRLRRRQHQVTHIFRIQIRSVVIFPQHVAKKKALVSLSFCSWQTCPCQTSFAKFAMVLSCTNAIVSNDWCFTLLTMHVIKQTNKPVAWV